MIRDRYRQENTVSFRSIEQINEEMEEIENEVVEMIEETTDKELVQLINVECELGKIKEAFDKNGKTQLQIDIMMD